MTFETLMERLIPMFLIWGIFSTVICVIVVWIVIAVIVKIKSLRKTEGKREQ